MSNQYSAQLTEFATHLEEECIQYAIASVPRKAHSPDK